MPGCTLCTCTLPCEHALPQFAQFVPLISLIPANLLLGRPLHVGQERVPQSPPLNDTTNPDTNAQTEATPMPDEKDGPSSGHVPRHDENDDLSSGADMTKDDLSTFTNRPNLSMRLEHTTFAVPEQEWLSLRHEQVKRTLPIRWTNLFVRLISEVNPYCVIRWLKHGAKTISSRRRDGPIFTASGNCSIQSCKMSFTLEMLDETTREVSMIYSNNHVYHHSSCLASRNFSADVREAAKVQLKFGKPPAKEYLDKMSSIPLDIFEAGNRNKVGKSRAVFRQIASEARQVGQMDKDLQTSLVYLQQKLVEQCAGKIIPGFIQLISLQPFNVIMFSETTVRLYHYLAKRDVVFWDATGSIVRKSISKAHGKDIYMYTIVMRHPIRGHTPIPVAWMLSNDHTMVMTDLFLRRLLHAEYRIFGFNAIPKQVNSDWSQVFIQAALLVYNKETMPEYLQRAYSIAIGEAKSTDFNKTFLHLCASHFMKVSQGIAKKMCHRGQKQFMMYCISLLMNARTLVEASCLWKSICVVMGNRDSTRILAKEQNLLFDAMSSLSTEERNYIDKDITLEDFFIDCEDIEQSCSPFHKYFEDIMKSATAETTHNESVLQKNNYYNPALMKTLLRRIMGAFPLWSALLLGDLRRHNPKYSSLDVERFKYKKGTSYRTFLDEARTQGDMERYQGILKNITLAGKRSLRPDTVIHEIFNDTVGFHRQLRDELIPQRTPKKAKKVEEELWCKKGKRLPKKHTYQTPPSDKFLDSGRCTFDAKAIDISKMEEWKDDYTRST